MIDFDLEFRLRRWADWWHSMQSGDAGYSRQSSIYLFQNGFVYNTKMTSRPLIRDSKELETDKMVQALTKAKPELAEPLLTYYLSDKPVKEMAKMLKMSKRNFHQKVYEARTWMSGYMAAS